MKIQAPEFRCGTKVAMESLARELNLPYYDRMQDWPYEVAESMGIEKYLNHYDGLTDEDQKFVLMEMIIQATTDQPTAKLFHKYWVETKKRLIKDFDIHQYTVYYWSCFDNERLEDCWTITPNMRQLWTVLNT